MNEEINELESVRKAIVVGFGTEKNRCIAFCEGLKKHGVEVTFAKKNEIPIIGYDLAIVCGMHEFEERAIKRFASRYIPTIVCDLGYMRRAKADDNSGYHQFGYHHIGWTPKEPVSGDRLAQLGIGKIKRASNSGSGYLVAGQVPNDSQHKMNVEQCVQWFRNAAFKIRAMTKNHRKIIFRPHPRFPAWTKLADFETQDCYEMDIEEAIHQCYCLVTYNSTAAIEAIIQGKPIICSEQAHYANLGNRILDAGNERVASVNERKSYLERLAYAQWTLEEAASGAAWGFLKTQYIKEKDVLTKR